MKTHVILILNLMLVGSHAYAEAERAPIIGVNLRGYGGVSEAQQDAKLKELSSYGVTTIREGFPSQIENNFDRFIIAAYRRGIGTIAIIYPTLGGMQKHTSQIDASVGRRWRVPALIDADPEGFKKAFKAQLDLLENAGVRLTAFEIGNEFNTVGYNADFSAHGSGRVLGLADLNNPKDGEAERVAAGYLQYVKILAVAREIRDHSKLNRSTPIVTGGLSNVGVPGPKSFNGQVATSVSDTITFLSEHGADRLVDGWGVHAYTSGDPNQTVTQRTAVLETIFHACTQKKACWLTEWRSTTMTSLAQYTMRRASTWLRLNV